jgi:hypothetical protein
MADFDVVASTVPQMEYRPTRNYGRKTIAELKTEIQAIDATTYTDAEVLKMTYNDLTYAIHALS